MNNRMLQRVLSLFMVLAFGFSVFSVSAFAKTDADFQQNIKELEQQIAGYDENEEIGQKNLQKNLDQLAGIEKELQAIDGKIAENNQEITKLDEVIAGYQKEIDKLDAQIQASEKKQTDLENSIQSTYDLLGERLCSAYVSGETSSLEILLTAEDFQDFLTRSELLQRISQNDTALVADLQHDIDDLKATQDKLKQDKAGVEEKRAGIKAERDKQAEKRSQNEQVKSSKKTKQNAAQAKADRIYAYLDKNQANKGRAEAELEREKEAYLEHKAAQMESGSGSLEVGGNSNFPQSSKGMIRPLQYPNVKISAGWYGYPGHKGIDFVTSGGTGNTYGKEIRAAADGVVSTAEWHKSWGNNVYINHGNGVYTRYAHCSRLIVSTGQKVKQGQVIAYVGNTGNVSPRPTTANPHAGAHLHFEVWVKTSKDKPAVRVNPAPWLP